MSKEQELESRVKELENKVKKLSSLLGKTVASLDNASAKTDLVRSETNITGMMNSLSSKVEILENKLTQVQLPEQTKWYLSQNEIENFRSSFAQLKAIMAEFRSLYTGLVSYSVNKPIRS